MSKQNKTAILNFKVDPKVKEEFQALCEEHFKNPADEMRRFVNHRIEELKRKSDENKNN